MWIKASWVVAFVVACTACTSNDNPAASDASADATVDSDYDGPAICNFAQFEDAGGNGGPCPYPAQTLCFPECTTGGCTCIVGAAGKPVWHCTLDNSCLPDCSPLQGCGDDASNIPADAARDAGLEATTDAPVEASVDGGADTGGDAIAEAAIADATGG